MRPCFSWLRTSILFSPGTYCTAGLPFASPLAGILSVPLVLVVSVVSVFVVSFLVSLFVTFAVVRSSTFHLHLSADFDFSGPQKFHARAVPRIGGLGVITAIVAAGVFGSATGVIDDTQFWLLVACGLPAFLVGITEDLTKSVFARWRLLATCVSMFLVIIAQSAATSRAAPRRGST